MKRTWIEKQPEEMPPSARRVIAISDGYVTHCALAGAAKVKSVIADYVRTYDFNGGHPNGHRWSATLYEYDGAAWAEKNSLDFDPVFYMSDRLYKRLVAAWEKERQ